MYGTGAACFDGVLSLSASVDICGAVQLEELEYNLWEHVLCRVVDYGHAFSPEIEMAALMHGDELLHGEAVNIDMALTTQVLACSTWHRLYITRYRAVKCVVPALLRACSAPAHRAGASAASSYPDCVPMVLSCK